MASRRDENVELVRRGLDAYNRADLGAMLEMLDPAVEIYTAPGLLNSATYTGHEGWRRWIQQWDEAWEEFVVQIDAIEPVGERHVVVSVRQSGRGVGSGVVVDGELAHLYEIGDDGKATRFHLYPDRDAALNAARRLAGEGDEGA
jgi:ketosteroid isomerase-like protein